MKNEDMDGVQNEDCDLSIVKAEDKVPSVIKPNAAAATPDCFKMTKVLDDRK